MDVDYDFFLLSGTPGQGFSYGTRVGFEISNTRCLIFPLRLSVKASSSQDTINNAGAVLLMIVVACSEFLYTLIQICRHVAPLPPKNNCRFHFTGNFVRGRRLGALDEILDHAASALIAAIATANLCSFFGFCRSARYIKEGGIYLGFGRTLFDSLLLFYG